MNGIMSKNLKIGLLFFLVFDSFIVDAQLEQYNEKRHDLDQKLMIGLGSWASLNLIGSGIGLSNALSDESRSFHQMNIMWNTVNLGLAIPGYIKARRANSDLTFSETYNQQRKTETVFLINAGLDLVYISGGLIFRSESKSNLDQSMNYKGYGNGLLVQGGFLLIFDWIAYGIHRSRAKKVLQPLLDTVELSDNGFGIKVTF